MRILVVGGSGTVGRAAIAELGRRHEIITAGRNSGDLRVEIADEASIRAMFDKAGKIDAVISTAGHVHFGPLTTMTGEQFKKGLLDKLLGQVNLALIGLHHVNDGGSITLTSGVVNRDPIRQGANSATVDGAIDAFVVAAAIEMPRGLRINAVSPGLIEESVKIFDGYFPGHEPVSSARVGLAFAKSVEGALTGKVFIIE
ncbi:MAG: short chain dehydrogenase [Rhizobiales bacterium]|nr:short chain dehydrogenase [Hyphomicrobiales bacterium]MBI3674419.1 short chain dehydrogenase [Hyphomicrobiales bacterium]